MPRSSFAWAGLLALYQGIASVIASTFEIVFPLRGRVATEQVLFPKHEAASARFGLLAAHNS